LHAAERDLVLRCLESLITAVGLAGSQKRKSQKMTAMVLIVVRDIATSFYINGLYFLSGQKDRLRELFEELLIQFGIVQRLGRRDLALIVPDHALESYARGGLFVTGGRVIRLTRDFLFLIIDDGGPIMTRRNITAATCPASVASLSFDPTTTPRPVSLSSRLKPRS